MPSRNASEKNNASARSEVIQVHDSNHKSRALPSYKQLIKSKKDLLLKFSLGDSKEDFPEDYSEIIDHYFRSSVQESDTAQELFRKRIPFALIAVGGYGRKELCLNSDIDIFILFNKKIPPEAKALTEEVYYPLWDLGLELGYGVRTINDCLKLGLGSFEVFTSLLDARFLCGNSLLYLTLMENLRKRVVKKRSAAFAKWLEDLDKIRINVYGDASHLLEPNVKEGIGGLRDYHHILWSAKVFLSIREAKELERIGKLSHREYYELNEKIRFLLLVRNYLHQFSGRKNDRLTFEYQKKIAHRLGYKNMKKTPAVELFLGKLHADMEFIKGLHRYFLTSHIQKRRKGKKDLQHKDIGFYTFQDELIFNSPKEIINDPAALMDIFEKSSLSGLLLSMEAKRLVRDHLYLVDNTFRRSQRTTQGFLNILKNRNTVETLDQMFETGFLDAFIPEFGRMKEKVQFDAYHLFPVGRHVLKTVANLKNLPEEKDLMLMGILDDLSDYEQLLLAGLFHDIGKNGKAHARRGARITRAILERFNYPIKQREEIIFLVENHLLLVETSQRRDLNDEKVIIQCARKIGSIERLKALYLLTWADSKATGPRAWNDWIAKLVKEIFLKILHIMERGELATPDTLERVRKTKKRARRLTMQKISRVEFENLFNSMSPRYKLNTEVQEMAHHLEMVKMLEKDIADNRRSTAFILDVKESTHGKFWEVTLVAKDRHGLFSDIAGVMALNNINILSSNIYTWTDETALDIFSVTGPPDSINPDEKWEKINRDLKDTFNGKLALSYRLSEKTAPSVLTVRKSPSHPPKVVIDNESSDFFTLIEVFADDRIGLLYLITRTLFELRMDIHVAKTGVKGDQIADVFYVRDLEGQKVEDEKQVHEIKKALIHHLSQ
jgi:[protein-PII] uridylyltransferase